MDNNFEQSGYRLVWGEEFSGDSAGFLDWNVEARPAGEFNNELQEYVQSEENVYVKNDILYIRPVRRVADNGDVTYTSGLLTTRNKHEFTYGKFEARIKIPYTNGFMPFFKLCCNPKIYGKWPVGGQIDILSVPTRLANKNYVSIHYGENQILEQAAYSFPVGYNAADDFHVYTCEWIPGKISFSIDGEQFFESNVEEPFNHPFYIQLGMGIGGQMGGALSTITDFSEDGALLVDYIRVYQKDEYQLPLKGEARKLISVCGSWEDAENFNIFLRSFDTPEIRDKYLVSAYTFGALEHEDKRIDENKFVEYIEQSKPDVMVVFAQMIRNEEIIEALIKIAHDRDIPLFMFEKPHEGVINVACQYDEGFDNICRHIVEYHGIKNVDMFAGFRGNEFSDRRIAIFKKVLKDNGVAVDERRIHYGDFWDEAASQVLEGLLNSGYKVPEAIICANDSMALGVESTLKRHGYKVPEDVKIAGFDGIRETSLHNPAITSCCPDYYEFVNDFLEIVDNWEDKEKHQSIIDTSIEVNYKYLYRTSCGCKRQESEEEVADLVSIAARDNTDNFRHMYEMSRFVSKAVQVGNFFDALSVLERHLWLWANQYYFVALKGNDTKLRVLFSGYKNVYKHDHRYINLNKALPDIDMLIEKDSGINFLLFKQIRVHSDDFVFACTGLKDITLRSEQRFEEFALFTSTVLNSVYNNQNYVSANAEIKKLSESDVLTGLYNRRGFMDELERRIEIARGKKKILTLFSVDMDGLKYINDTFGHNAGDNAIVIMGEALLRFVGGRGICARYGGDEFAFAILSYQEGEVDLDSVHRELASIISDNPRLEGVPYNVTASIGFAQKQITSADEINDMIKEADVMMYNDKKIRKGKKS